MLSHVFCKDHIGAWVLPIMDANRSTSYSLFLTVSGVIYLILTRDTHLMQQFIYYYKQLYMFRASICPSSGVWGCIRIILFHIMVFIIINKLLHQVGISRQFHIWCTDTHTSNLSHFVVRTDDFCGWTIFFVFCGVMSVSLSI